MPCATLSIKPKKKDELVCYHYTSWIIFEIPCLLFIVEQYRESLALKISLKKSNRFGPVRNDCVLFFRLSTISLSFLGLYHRWT